MLVKKGTLLILSVVAAACLLLFACGPRIKTFPGLKDEGILPLSDSNAFNGANLFLAKEMEKSAYLHNFIKGNGAPTAIELEESTYGPTRLLMFYARTHSLYIAVPEKQNMLREWIIRGPYQVKWKDDKELQRLLRTAKAEPPFYLWGREQRFPVAGESKNTTVVRVAIPPTPAPTPRPRRTSSSNAKKTVKKTTGQTPVKLDPAQFQNLNTDQKALLLAQGYAPRTNSGDLIHITKSENESLSSIAKWYTGSEQAEKEIAEFNKLTPGEPLAAGTKVVIPLGKLKQLKLMPAEIK